MRQTIIIGESFPELLDCLMWRIADARNDDPFHSDLIVVPNYPLVRYLEDFLARRSARSLLNVHIMPLRLVLDRYYPPDRDKPSILSPAALHAFTHFILKDMYTLGDVSWFGGMENGFQKTADELTEAGLHDPEVLEAYICDRRDHLGSTDRDTLRVYGKWLERIRTMSATHPGFAASAAEIPLRFDAIHIYGFLTMRDIYSEILHRRISIDPPDDLIRYHPGYDAYTGIPLTGLDYSKELLEPEIGATAIIEHASKISGATTADRRESSPVKREVLGIIDGGKCPEEREAIHVEAAPGVEAEVSYAAQEIIHIIETGENTDLGGIGIILSAKNRMLDVFRRVFSEYSIPYHVAGTVNAINTPELNWLHELFLLGQNDFSVEDVISVLRSPWSSHAGAVPHEDWHRIRNRLVSAGIRFLGVSAWRSVLESDPDHAVILEDFLTDYHTLNGSSDIQTWLNRLDQLLAKWGAPDLLAKDVVIRWRRELDDFLYLSSQHDATDELGPILLGCAINRLINSRVQITTPDSGGVIVGSLPELFGMIFERLFVIGANKGVIPATIPEDPLLSDAIRTSMAMDLGYPLQTRAFRYQNEKLMFMLSILSAEKTVYLTYSTIDESGKALAPSILVSLFLGHDYRIHTIPYRMIERVDEHIRRERFISPRDVFWVTHESEAPFQDGWKELASFLYPGYLDTLAYGIESRLARYDMRQVSSYDIRLDERYQDIINPLNVVQAWNDLDDCPYRFFLRHVLGFEEPIISRDTWWMDELETGSLLHRFFYELFSPERMEKDLPAEYWAGSTWEQTVEAYLKDQPQDRLAAVKDYELTRAGNWIIPLGIREIERIRDYRSDFREVEISREMPLSNFTLTVGSGNDRKWRVRMNLRADRIDTLRNPGGARESRIIDYKVRSNRSLWEKDARNLQLYIYAKAFSFMRQWPVSSAYVEIVRRGTPDEVRTVRIPPDNREIDELFSEKLRLLGILWFGDTRFFPFTRDDKICSYCAVRTCCRRFDTPLLEKSGRFGLDHWLESSELNQRLKEELKSHLEERYR